jgi:hypothetical protein
MDAQIESNVSEAARMQLCSIAWTHGHMVTQVESHVAGAIRMLLNSFNTPKIRIHRKNHNLYYTRS